jgi:peptidoglycan biosynthesis protein MviN/MurJ (putative lipid II flippase)
MTRGEQRPTMLGVLTGSFVMNTLAKLAGLPRVYWISRTVGDSVTADVYFQGWLVLTTMEAVVYMGAVYMAAIPDYVKAEARIARSGVLAGAAVVLWGVTALFLMVLAAAGPSLVRLVSPGFNEELQAVNLKFLWDLWPSIVSQPLLAIVSIVAAVHGRFTLVNAVQLSRNLLFLAAAFGMVAPTIEGIALALNVSYVGSVLVIGAQIWPLLPREWPANALHAAQHLAQRALPVFAVLSFGELYANVDRALATTVGPGFVSQLSYARTIVSFTVAIAYSTVQIVYFNTFASAVDIATSLWQSLRALAFVIVPVVTLVVVLREDAVSVVLSGRAVSAGGHETVQRMIVALAGVVMLDAGSGMISSALIARGASGVAAVVQGVALVTLLTTFTVASSLGPTAALIVALCLASVARAISSAVAAGRHLGTSPPAAVRALLTVVGCGVASGVVSAGLRILLPSSWWAAAVVGAVGSAAYAAVTLLVGVPEARTLWHRLRTYAEHRTVGRE